MWPYPWTHVGTPSHLGHMDRVAATMPSQAHAGATQEEPDIGQWEGHNVPLVRPSSCFVKGGIPSSRRYLPTYLSQLPPSLARPPVCLYFVPLSLPSRDHPLGMWDATFKLVFIHLLARLDFSWTLLSPHHTHTHILTYTCVCSPNLLVRCRLSLIALLLFAFSAYV